MEEKARSKWLKKLTSGSASSSVIRETSKSLETEEEAEQQMGALTK